MRLIPALALLSFACTPQTTVLGSGSDDTGGASGDTDTGSDTGADTADTEDTGPPPDLSEGDYTGSMVGSLESDWGGMECVGEVTASVDAAGELVGTLTCEFGSGDWGGYTYEGELTGVESEGEVEAWWVLDFGRDTVDVPGVGTYEEGVMIIDFEYDFGNYGMFYGTADLERE